MQSLQNYHIESTESDFGAPSVGPTGLIPSAAQTSFPSGLIPSAPRTSSIIPSDVLAIEPELPQSSPEAIITAPVHTGLIPSRSVVPADPQSTPQDSPLVPSASGVETFPSSDVPIITGTTNASIPSVMPTKASTDEPLRPVPGPTTNPGDPNGHHEISEPNFTNTSPCKGCSPIVQIPATGWDDFWTHPAAEPQETTERPPAATITAGPSNIVITQGPSGSDFVVGDSTRSTTVKAGETVIVDNTPIVIQTSAGHPQIIVDGTQTVPLGLGPAVTAAPHQITNPPAVLLPITIGTQTFTPIANTASNGNSNSNPSPNGAAPALYIVDGQTLLPGGAPLTVSGTTYSLDQAATVIQINDQYATLTPTQAVIYTTSTAPALTIFGKTVTANRAGYYIITSGVTLIPGGAPLTYDGTIVSLLPEGTAAIIQGSTTMLLPASTIVTVTKTGALGASGGVGGSGGDGEATAASGPGATLPYPSGTAAALGVGGMGLGGAYALFVLVVGWAAVWL